MANINDTYKINFDLVGINKIAKYQQGLAATKKELKELRKEIAKQETATVAQANQLSRAEMQQDKYTESIKKGKEAILAQKRGFIGNAKAMMGNVAGMAKLGGVAFVVVKALKAIVRVLNESLKSYAEYEKGVKNVLTLFSGSDSELLRGEIFENAIKLSTDFGFSVNDVSKALFNAVSAGISAGESIKFLNTASKLAIAGVTDLKSATLGLTTVINAYGLETKEAERVAEILFTTQKFGVTTVAELSKSIGVVVPFAAASGIKFEELGAAIAVTTRSGLDAAKTVTALRAAISQMQKPASESRDLFIRYGIPIGAAQMKLVGFSETMRRLHKVFIENNADLEKMFGNVRGLTAILSIAGKNSEDYAMFLEELLDPQTTNSNLSRAFAENLDSVDINMKRVTESINALKIAIGSASWLGDMVDSLAEFFSIINSNLPFLEKFLAIMPDFAVDPFDIFDDETRSRLIKLRIEMMQAAETSRLLKEAFLKPGEGGATAIEEISKALKDLEDDGKIGAKSLVTMNELVDNFRKLVFLDGDTQGLSVQQENLLKRAFKAFSEYLNGIEAEAAAAKAKQEKESQEATAIRMKFEKDEEAARRKLNLNLEALNEQRLNNEDETFKNRRQFQTNFQHMELMLIRDHHDAVANMEGINEDERIAARKKADEAQLKLNEMNYQEEEKQFKMSVQRRVAAEQALFTSIGNIQAASSNRFKANQEKELQVLQDKLDSGFITQEEFDKRQRKMEKEAAKRQKKMAIMNATLNFVQTLLQIDRNSNSPATPQNILTGGLFGVAQAKVLKAIAAAEFAVNIATIKATKFAKGGMVYGNSHSQGGEKFAVGGRVVELEGGEAVINRKSTAMFSNALSAINQAGGGVSFTSPNSNQGSIIDYDLLASTISQNMTVAIPVDTLSEVQRTSKIVSESSRF